MNLKCWDTFNIHKEYAQYFCFLQIHQNVEKIKNFSIDTLNRGPRSIFQNLGQGYREPSVDPMSEKVMDNDVWGEIEYNILHLIGL